jgi:hypothetical protein
VVLAGLRVIMNCICKAPNYCGMPDGTPKCHGKNLCCNYADAGGKVFFLFVLLQSASLLPIFFGDTTVW